MEKKLEALNIWRKVSRLNPVEWIKAEKNSTKRRYDFFQGEIIAGCEILNTVFKYENFNKITKENWCELTDERQMQFRIGISTYANTLYAMRGFLLRYDSDVAFQQGTPKVKVSNREIEKWKFWRNKVFAHPAAINPRKEDGEMRQVWSRAFWSGKSFGFQPKSKSLYFGGHDQKSTKQISLKKPINIVEDHPKIDKFFAKQGEVIIDFLERISEIRVEIKK